jgi:type VI secretion system protein ImpI
VRITPFRLHLQLVALPRELQHQAAARGTYDSAISPAVGTVQPQSILEQTALKCLDRLSQRFLGQPLQDPKEVAAFTSRLEETLAVFFRFFVALQQGQEQFRKALDIKALGAGGRNPVEEAKDAAHLATLLLSAERTTISSLEHAFKNIMLHQVALLNGLMAGVRTLLSRLSPKTVAKEAAAEARSTNPKVLWSIYERIHRDLAEEDNETFETIFGSQFAKSYSNLLGQKATKGGPQGRRR